MGLAKLPVFLENAKKGNLKIVYDKSYPPSTTDFTPIVRALQAANADGMFAAARSIAARRSGWLARMAPARRRCSA